MQHQCRQQLKGFIRQSVIYGYYIVCYIPYIQSFSHQFDHTENLKKATNRNSVYKQTNSQTMRNKMNNSTQTI